ncbi:exocyst complex component 6B-like protein [Turdus rufiventris]|nr:exocyst complex component 6B-like protein [Turdus rufiventris]
MHETLDGYRKYFNQIVGNILDSDNYSPIPVSNEEVYKKIVEQFPFQDAELEKQPFPKKFPFSEFVPRVYGQIQEFIHACLKFSEDLHLSLGIRSSKARRIPWIQGLEYSMDPRLRNILLIQGLEYSGKVAQTACMSACKHLSTSLLQLLLEAEVRQLTLGALHQFNLDVEECEQFARSGPVPGFQGDTLQLAFIDLRQGCGRENRQDEEGERDPEEGVRDPKEGVRDPEEGDALRKLLDLFIQWDWSTYLADYGQPTCKYLRVNPTTALVLLEKMRDTSRKNNVFAQFRKNERDKQKLIDTVAKQLRGLINSHHS